MNAKRRRVKQSLSLSERLHRAADELLEAAQQMPDGDAKDQLIKRARQHEEAARLEGWLSSPGLQQPA
ncbi:hypothetical protein [Bradyrhizobium sp. 195]|uniref:hypothetical protein n=1 Tax=Bradyrhizobium sp. 195 TaxID=2782662 RepID=UPI00200139B5|nr:hypothetical protein [Bradyrhizobium sp. 195]UPK23864.1 hypothetical protein IVB26_20925 [Bradyrhizobium sp. 195]